jgi:hypothetical protein
LSRQPIQSFKDSPIYLSQADPYSEVIALQEQNDNRKQYFVNRIVNRSNERQEKNMNLTQIIADIVASLFDAPPKLRGRRRHFARTGFGRAIFH